MILPLRDNVEGGFPMNIFSELNYKKNRSERFSVGRPASAAEQLKLIQSSDARYKADCLPRFSGLCNVVFPKSSAFGHLSQQCPVLNRVLNINDQSMT